MTQPPPHHEGGDLLRFGSEKIAPSVKPLMIARGGEGSWVLAAGFRICGQCQPHQSQIDHDQDAVPPCHPVAVIWQKAHLHED